MYVRPAVQWVEALPIGNGHLGALLDSAKLNTMAAVCIPICSTLVRLSR
ncbi:MAG: glycoside hydrolase family 95 protein [Planctomycetaceae bacterium]|nr:glycoside hydrolase family 95 protein [Planctomycetaceae bacterium]